MVFDFEVEIPLLEKGGLIRAFSKGERMVLKHRSDIAAEHKDSIIAFVWRPEEITPAVTAHGPADREQGCYRLFHDGGGRFTYLPA